MMGATTARITTVHRIVLERLGATVVWGVGSLLLKMIARELSIPIFTIPPPLPPLDPSATVHCPRYALFAP